MRNLTQLSLIAAATLTTATAFADLTDVHPANFGTRSTWSLGVSGDGLTYVGYSFAPASTRAFKIVGSTGTTLLPLAGQSASVAHAASNDGNIVVGYSVDSNSYNHAVKWTGTTVTDLDNTAAFVSSEATGVSANGATIVGWGYNASTFIYEAFYHRAGSINHLGILFGDNGSMANAISDALALIAKHMEPNQ